MVKTTIGFGSPNKAGKSSSHGSPLGHEEIALTKKALGWTAQEPFFVPPEAHAHFHTQVTRGEAARAAWRARFEAYRARDLVHRASATLTVVCVSKPGIVKQPLPDFVKDALSPYLVAAP